MTAEDTVEAQYLDEKTEKGMHLIREGLMEVRAISLYKIPSNFFFSSFNLSYGMSV